MAFRNYPKTKSLVIQKDSAIDLEMAVDSIQNEYDIIDLQFSTHESKSFNGTRYCVFLLLAEKGEINGK